MNSDLITLLLSFVVFMIFVGSRLIINKLKAPKGTGDVFKGISDKEKLDHSIARLNQIFHAPFNPYQVPQQVLDILYRDPNSEYALNLLLQDIASHCRYKRTAIVLKLYPEQKNCPPGQIQKLGKTFLMELHMNNEENIPGVISVIVHEFCHFLLDESGISLENTLDNEILTDTASVYFGFGHIMFEGYRPSFHVKEGKTHWHRIGYLDVTGLKYVQQQVEQLRKL